ncbi:MAG TPA: PAS domain S-box protein [Actinomycetota bacterium]|nr:PAS domain S-box protein [Actinomycetota bacterium]
MAEPVRILLLEDEPNDAELVQRALKGLAGTSVIRSAADEPSFLTELEEFRPDIVLADYTLPGFSGTEALEIVRARDPHVPFIFVTGSMGEEVAVDALRAGATDYVLKDRLERLTSATERALAESAERRRAEKAEQRYRLLVEQIDAITYVTEFGEDGEPRTTFMSPQVEEITGYPPQAWVEDPRLRLRILHPADAARVRIHERRCEREGVPFEGEYRVIAKNGRAVWIHDRMTAFKDASGIVRIAQGVMFDISDRKRAEEGIHRREEILRAVAFAAERFLRTPSWESVAREVLGRVGRAASADRVVVTSMRPDGRGEYLTNVRASWAAPGLPPIDLVTDVVELPTIGIGFGRWVEQLQAGEAIGGDVADFAESERQVMEAMGTRSLIAMPLFAGDEWYGALILSSDRLRPWSQAELDALSAAAGALGGAIARERSEVALAESEERFRRLAENAPDIIYRYRVFPEPGYEFVSDSVTRLTGYTPAEYYAEPGIGLRTVHPDHREELTRNRWPAFDEPVRMRWVRKDGTTLWTEQRQVPVRDGEGRLLAVEGIDRDVTEQVEAEQAVRERVKELSCLSAVMRDAQEDLSAEELCHRAAGHLVAAMQFPESTVARVQIHEASADSRPGADLRSTISSEVRIVGRRFGEVTVGYTHDLEFLEEEQRLLDSVAETLAMWHSRREATDGLRESEERFRVLADNARDFVFRFRVLPTPGFEYVSRSVERISGYTPAELYERPDIWEEMVFPEEREQFETAMTAAVGGSGRFTARWRAKDGRAYWSETQLTPVTDRDGTMIAIEGIARDVTDRMEAERALEARARQQAAVAELGAFALSDQPLGDFLDGAAALIASALQVEHVGILEARSETDLVIRAAAGWPPEWLGDVIPYGDLTSQAGFSMAHDQPLIVDDLDREDRFVPGPRLVDAGMRSVITVVIPGEDGPFGILAAYAREPSRFREEDVDFLRAVAHMLAESVRLRAASTSLARKEREFRALAENSPDIISRHDRELRILYINPAVELATGVPPEAFIGNTNRQNQMPEDARKRWDPAIRKAIETGEPSTIEFDWDTPQGARYYEAQVIPELDEGGEVTSVLGVARDLTDRRETQRQLEENLALLHRTDRERSKLLSQIASAQEEERKRIAADIHDDSIQVMTAAGMRLGILRRRLHDEKQIEALDAVEATVKRSIRRLRRLMFELQPPALERAGLSAAIHAYLEAPLSEDGAGPEYHITDRLEREPPPDARALLYRIVQEALANVRKHAGASNVMVDLEERDGGFAALIVDDGEGFDPDAVDSTLPGHLGLSSMRERADLLGGECTIISAPGEGTTVNVWVPADDNRIEGNVA